MSAHKQVGSYATIFSEFLADKEKKTGRFRYTFEGFELKLIQEVSRKLERSLLIKIPVISTSEDYSRAIKSRASNDSIFIQISIGKISEHSSLCSTFKSLTNEFYPFRKRITKAEGVYDLYDISEWLFQRANLERIATKVLPHAEFSRKKDQLNDVFIALENLWNLGKETPSLRNRMSPELLTYILTYISSSQFDFNTFAEIIGFEPSLSLVQLNDEASVRGFVVKTSRLIPLLKGSDPDKRSKLATLAQNFISGILFFYSINLDYLKPAVPKDLNYLVECFKKKNKFGRRIWIVFSTDVEILEYSLTSGFVKKIRFRIRNRETKQICVMDRSWNKYFKSQQLSSFLKFMQDNNLLGPMHLSKLPFELEVNSGEITVAFKFLEGYLFALKNFRKALDEISV